MKDLITAEFGRQLADKHSTVGKYFNNKEQLDINIAWDRPAPF